MKEIMELPQLKHGIFRKKVYCFFILNKELVHKFLILKYDLCSNFIIIQ